MSEDRAIVQIGSALPVEGDATTTPEERQARWHANREAILRLLRQAPGFMSIVRALNDGAICKIRLPPNIWQALREHRAHWKVDNQAGGVLPTVYGEKGEFVKQARLEPIPGDVAAAVTSLLLLQGMARIEQGIREVQAAIEEVRQGQVADRRGMIQAGLDQYRHALCLQSPDARRSQLLNAVQTLTVGRRQLLAQAENDIANAYRLPRSGGALDFETVIKGKNVPAQARRHLDEAGESVRWALEATQCMCEAYTQLGAVTAAEHACNDVIEWWKNHAEHARAAARLIPWDSNGPLPENLWAVDRLEAVSLERLRIPQSLHCEIEIEAHKEELVDDRSA
ncbi:MAG: hypothetical protein HY271_06980 [Deltaproteobacteria bacterium]|nr:hypothetical protein [Deltaproteobacteria bacterium]